MWYWYVAKVNELLIDLDQKSGERQEKLTNAGARLRGAIEGSHLSVRDVWLYPSATAMHHHLIVRLNYGMGPVERFSWEIYLRSDLYRGLNNIMRQVHWIGAPGLLISDQKYYGFYRKPDTDCQCVTKHDIKTMKSCPVALKLRGSGRTLDFFGKPSNEKVEWTFGKVEL